MNASSMRSSRGYNGESLSYESFSMEVDKYPVLTLEEEHELIPLAQAGDEDAITRVIMGQARTVMAFANRYVSERIAKEDVIQEGMIGIMVALERYDLSSGYRFYTYAQWYVRSFMQKLSAKYRRVVNIPIYFRSADKKIADYIRSYKDEHIHYPYIPDVAEMFNVTEAAVENIMASMIADSSLNVAISSDSSYDFIDMIQSKDLSDSDMDAIDLAEALASAMAPLCERDRDVISRLYGLSGDTPSTLEEVGESYGLSRERIRQLRCEIIDHLSVAKTDLKTFYNDL